MYRVNSLIKHACVALVLLGLAGTSLANNAGWTVKPGQTDPNQRFHQRLPAPFHDDITADQVVTKLTLTPAQTHQALVWGLSPLEEKRYVALMRNRSGFFYQGTGHHLTPVQVLGVNAPTDAKRSAYAARDAHQQFEQLAKYLAYNAAYQQAATAYKTQLHLPVIRSFNTTPFSPYTYQPISLQAGDHVLLFVHLRDAVKPIMAYLMSAVARMPRVQLGIFFVGNATRYQVQQWAREQALPIQLVSSHRITLDFDHGQFATLGIKQPLPVLVRVRGGHSEVIDTGRF